MKNHKLKFSALLAILLLSMLLNTKIFCWEPIFAQVVNVKEKVFGKVLVADEWGTYPLPENIPRGWEIDNPGEWRNIPNDYFNIGQIRFRQFIDKTIIQIKLYRHFIESDSSLTLREVKKRIDRLRTLKEVQLVITPGLKELLESSPN